MLVLAVVAMVAVVALWAGWLVARPPALVDPTAPALPVRSARRWRHPASLAGSELVVGAVAVVLSGIALGWLLRSVDDRQGVARWDDAAARFGADHATGAVRSVLRALTQLGGTRGVVLLALAVVVAERGRGRVWATAVFLTLVIGGASIASTLVKAAVDRERPAVAQLVGFSGSSFPSGHSTTAAAAFAAFAMVLGRRRPRRVQRGLAALALATAAAVAASRVLLGVHWLTDVLAGLALGWGWFAVCSVAFGGRLLRFGAPAAARPDVGARGTGGPAG